MEEDILNYTPTVMFRGTLFMKNFLQISTILVFKIKVKSERCLISPVLKA